VTGDRGSSLPWGDRSPPATGVTARRRLLAEQVDWRHQGEKVFYAQHPLVETMERTAFVPIGVVGLAGTTAVVAVFGARSVLTIPVGALQVAGLLAASGCALLAGLGVDVGPASWRTFAGLAYVLMAVVSGSATIAADVTAYSYMPAPLFYAVVLGAGITLVAVGLDVALDREWIVDVEEPSPDQE
jgi:hypothetical protein